MHFTILTPMLSVPVKVEEKVLTVTFPMVIFCEPLIVMVPCAPLPGIKLSAPGLSENCYTTPLPMVRAINKPKAVRIAINEFFEMALATSTILTQIKVPRRSPIKVRGAR